MNITPHKLFSRKCNDCTSWSMDKEPLLSTKVSENLSDFNTDGQHQLPVRKAEFEELEQAICHCHQKLKEGEWSSSEASIYLSMYGINNKLQESVVTNGEMITTYPK